MNRLALILTLVLSLIIFGCAKTSTTQKTPAAPGETPSAKKDSKGAGSDLAAWMSLELTDTRTGEKFKISDFKGTPVLLETFAVWCSTCKKQQDQIAELHEKLGDKVVSISVDADPGEDAAKISEHADRYNYEWRFASDSNQFARSLVDDFGVNVVNAPSAPIILIDADQNAELLRFGVKSATELEKAIEKSGE